VELPGPGVAARSDPFECRKGLVVQGGEGLSIARNRKLIYYETNGQKEGFETSHCQAKKGEDGVLGEREKISRGLGCRQLHPRGEEEGGDRKSPINRGEREFRGRLSFERYFVRNGSYERMCSSKLGKTREGGFLTAAG